MPENRYFLDEQLKVGNDYSLDYDESVHLMRVMRGQINDRIEIINGRGQLACGSIIALAKNEARIRIESIEPILAPPPPLHLIQAIVRGVLLDTIVEKGCELGMSAIWLFAADLSIKKSFKNEQLSRLRRLLIAATKQCGRLDLPQVHLLEPMNSWKKSDLPDLPLFFGDLTAHAPRLLDKWQTGRGASFIVGPEAGFSEKEYKILEKIGAQGVRLNSHILRAETASIAALALMSHFIVKPVENFSI